MSDAFTERVLARYLLEPKTRMKTAAFPPGPPNPDNGSDSTLAKRNIPKDHEFQARALKPLSKALWASTVALGHALTAYRHLSRLKSATVSPDGLMGGRGYVMKLSEMRQKLYEASEALSTISDTIFDEINGPHWKPKLAQLDESDQEDVTRFIEEAEGVMENPEGDAEDEIEEIEGSKSKRSPKKDSMPGREDDSSSLPSGDAQQGEPSVRPEPVPRTKEARIASDQVRVADLYSDLQPGDEPSRMGPEHFAQAIYVKTGNSSLPVSELSGGPRVDHLGPGNGQGEYGDFGESGTLTPPADPWNADGGGLSRRDSDGEDYDYSSEWENDMSSATANSSVPDSSSDDTPTDGWDFGIGYGARGEGAGGYASPSGEGVGDKGVWGPHSGLPGTPSQSTGDATHLVLDEALNRHAVRRALYGRLPQDAARDVARSDYYPGAKDNMVSVGTSETPTPHDTKSDSGQPLLNTYYTNEDTNTDYERYDYATHTLREPAGLGQDHREPLAPDGEATR